MTHRIAVIAGDGIGPAVMTERLRVLGSVSRKFGISFSLDHFDWGCEHSLRKGSMMAPGWRDQISA